MSHKITILQEVIIKGRRYDYGHQLDYSKKRLAWLKKKQINYQVTGDDK